MQTNNTRTTGTESTISTSSVLVKWSSTSPRPLSSRVLDILSYRPPLQAYLLCTANEQAAKSQLCRCVPLNQAPDVSQADEEHAYHKRVLSVGRRAISGKERSEVTPDGRRL